MPDLCHRVGVPRIACKASRDHMFLALRLHSLAMEPTLTLRTCFNRDLAPQEAVKGFPMLAGPLTRSGEAWQVEKLPSFNGAWALTNLLPSRST